MKLSDSVGLAAAEQVERSIGAWAGLASFRRVLAHAEGSEARAKAALGALRCAMALGDADAALEVAAAWRTIGRGRHLDAVVSACWRLMRSGRSDAALALAEAETEREPSPLGFYLVARCHEQAGHADAALDSFLRAAEGAADAGAVRAASLARIVEALPEGDARRARAEGMAATIDLATATPAQRLVLVRSRLGAPGRFARAAALSTLADLAKGGDVALTRAAVRAAAAHADAQGAALSPVEADRIAAALACWPDAAERDAALARLAALARIAGAPGEAEREAALRDASAVAPEVAPLLDRARAVLEGGGLGAHGRAEGDATLVPVDRALDAIAAMAADRPIVAAESLDRAADALASGAAPVAVWTAAHVGLGHASPRVVGAAARLAERLLERGRGAPPRGFAAFASALARAGRADLAMRARRAAADAREPGARGLLAVDMTREAFRLAAAGERGRAIALLREAKAMAGGAS